jgi:hypothetical protein
MSDRTVRQEIEAIFKSKRKSPTKEYIPFAGRGATSAEVGMGGDKESWASGSDTANATAAARAERAAHDSAYPPSYSSAGGTYGKSPTMAAKNNKYRGSTYQGKRR